MLLSSKHNPLPGTRTPVYIDILPESSSWWSTSSSHSRGPSSLYKSPQGAIAFHPSSNTPRRMRDIDPTVIFVSTSVVIAKSSYIILLDGAPIHSEDTKLECIGRSGPYFISSVNPSYDEGSFLYSTALVPKYWEVLCKSPDPTIYTILHDVYRPAKPAHCLPRCLGRPRPILIFSATYHFRYQVSARTPPSSVASRCAYQANSPFIANTARSYYDLLEPVWPREHPMHPSPPVHKSHQSREDSSQNPLYEQSTLDANLGDGDFMVGIHDSPEATSKEMILQSVVLGFPNDIRNYNM
ncbi:hypothetical protein EDB19DRAFT_1908894 [Suillus lakei]|nr:hypothetical protein EDB19DRAFT_1908894 [Suillus lakei]